MRACAHFWLPFVSAAAGAALNMWTATTRLHSGQQVVCIAGCSEGYELVPLARYLAFANLRGF